MATLTESKRKTHLRDETGSALCGQIGFLRSVLGKFDGVFTLKELITYEQACKKCLRILEIFNRG